MATKEPRHLFNNNDIGIHQKTASTALFCALTQLWQRYKNIFLGLKLYSFYFPNDIGWLLSKQAIGNVLIIAALYFHQFAKVSIWLEEFQKHFSRHFEHQVPGKCE